MSLCVAAVVCEQPIEFEPRGGLVYVTDPTTGSVRVFRFHTFYATFHNAAKCMQECHGLETAEIIEFPRVAVGKH